MDYSLHLQTLLEIDYPILPEKNSNAHQRIYARNKMKTSEIKKREVAELD